MRFSRSVRKLGRGLVVTGLVGATLAGPVGGLTGPAEAAARGELLTNGTFDTTATAPWWNSANTTLAASGGRLRATVPAGTVNTYDSMVGQSAVVLTTGKRYTLVFDASASAAVTVRVTVQLGESPYTMALDQQIALDGTLRRFTLPFTSSLTTTGGIGQVTFQLGGTGAFTATLDNISLARSPLDLTSGFYSDPASNAYTWLSRNPNDSWASSIRTNLAQQAGGKWFGNWNAEINDMGTPDNTDDDYLSKVRTYVSEAEAAGKLPILVAYNIPGRDCGGESSGGAGSAEDYRMWIANFARAIGDRHAVVIIEPDSINQAMVDSCMTGAERQARLDLLKYATEQFRDKTPTAWAYLDGGNYGWNTQITPATVALAMNSAGLRNVRGFALNVSNFYTTAESNTAGARLNDALAGAYGYRTRYIVDTARNGNGALNGESWCNPPGRKLGVTSRVGTGGAELLLWVKVPGDSDGICGLGARSTALPDGIEPGQFHKKLATALINGDSGVWP